MIKLVSVIGHGIQLLPHFIKHYQQHVDEINLVVYETERTPLLANEVRELIDNYENVKIVRVHQDRIFDWNRVTMLYNYITDKEPDTWWVVADIDEFQLYPNDHLPSLVKTCQEYGYTIVRGGFIDRVGLDGGFPKIVDNKSIFEQFPMMGFFRYPLSYANPNKICLMRGNVELTSGQHYAKIDGHTTWRWQGWNHPQILNSSFIQVHHFKWDSTAIERIKQVSDIKQEYAYSDEYKLMYDQLKKSKFKIDLNNPEFMFQSGEESHRYKSYRQWDKLIKKIMSI